MYIIYALLASVFSGLTAMSFTGAEHAFRHIAAAITAIIVFFILNLPFIFLPIITF